MKGAMSFVAVLCSLAALVGLMLGFLFGLFPQPGMHLSLWSLGASASLGLLSLAAHNAAERDLCSAKPYWAQ